MSIKSATDTGRIKVHAPHVFTVDHAGQRFVSQTPPSRRFKVENLFAFKRGRGDIVFSCIMLALVLFLLWQFAAESGWDQRKLPQKRFGKILKQPWVGPFLCMAILIPAALLNVMQSIAKRRRDIRQIVPNRIVYELGVWARSFEFIAYFLIYTFAISFLGYLLSTLAFAVLLTYRLGYRTGRWIMVSLATAFAIVLLFRSLLQIKTPVNIWLYNQLPAGLETFMKVYF